MTAKVRIDIEADTKDAVANTQKYEGSLQDLAEQVARAGGDFNDLNRVIEQDIAALKSATPENAKYSLSYQEITRALSAGEISADQARQKLEALRAEMGQGEEKTRGLGLAWIDLQAKISIAKEAFQAVEQVYGGSVGKVMAYAEQVRQMTAVSGASAEEASRLAQVFDDLGLETSDLESAMESAARKGVVLNTEKLAELSDKYLTLQTREEKQQFLIDNMGRSGLAYARVLEQGGQKLREMSAAIEDGNVLTDEDIAKTEALRIAQDNLGDTWQAAINTLSLGVVPALADSIEILSIFRNETEKGKDGWMNYIPVLAQINYLFRLNDAILKHDAQTSQEAALGMGDLRREEERQANITKPAYTAATIAQSYATRALADALEKQKSADEASEIAAKEHAETEKQAFADLTTAQNNLTTARQNWAQGAASDIASAIDAAKMGAEKTKEAYGIVDEVMGSNLLKQSEYKTAYEKLVTDFATKKIDAAQFKTGVENLKSTFGELDTSVENSKTKIGELQDKIDALHGKDIAINIITGNGGAVDFTHSTIVPPSPRGGQGAGGGKAEQYASGTNDAPGGVAMVGERGPEMVVLPQHSRVVPNEDLGGVTFRNCSFQIVANNAPDLFHQLKSLANVGV